MLDLELQADRDQLLTRVAAADVLIESYDPGTAASLGIGHGTLAELNPRLVHVAITPFGQSGPKARWPATDFTLEAAGGRVAMQGDKDRPPKP